MQPSKSELDSPEDLLSLLESRGGDSYFGEPVTVLEHSLQAAHFAREMHCSNALVAAALLHDIGHLLHREEEDIAEHGVDTRHEELADELLSRHLPPDVTMPIRLHVAAKRYLCYADAAYREALSPSSLLSLQLQGGPMTEQEAKAFLAGPFARDAITLRRWDDEAKIPDLPMPFLHSYLPLLKDLWHVAG
jgi:[1-hydroxy-2-(trimethylamino)ethyl]phosphonate dioxygenase